MFLSSLIFFLISSQVAAFFMSVYLVNVFGSVKVYPGVPCKVSFAVIAKWSEIEGLS